MTFESLFHTLPIGVVVYEPSAKQIKYANPTARQILPFGTSKNKDDILKLFHFNHENDFAVLEHLTLSQGLVANYMIDINTMHNIQKRVCVNANVLDIEGVTHLLIYCSLVDEKDNCQATQTMTPKERSNMLMLTLHQMSTSDDNPQKKMNGILKTLGLFLHCSRVYLFETITDSMAKNTYEWCNENIPSQLEQLQNVNTKQPGWSYILSGNVMSTNSVSLPEEVNLPLEERGVVSMLVSPCLNEHVPIGYLCIDECTNKRIWSCEEFDLLQDAANLIASLLLRKKAIANSLHYHQTISTVLNNLSMGIYVSDIETYDIMFANASLLNNLGYHSLNQLQGKKCWQVFQLNQSGPCPFCPIKTIIDTHGLNPGFVVKSEFQNTITGIWYFLEDSLVEWFDGRLVHFQSALEFTARKQYEEELKFHASMDSLTNVYNREWGYRLLELERNLAKKERTTFTICFFDVDGLKQVNDKFGHYVGDELLKDALLAIKKNIRSSDILFRWAGDEFVLVLLQCNQKSANDTIYKIRASMELFNHSSGRPYNLSASIGIKEVLPENTLFSDELIMLADKAMYSEKFSKQKYIIKE